ncbi:MAG: chemotaxis protein CheB [Alphaproteobacteria bacterium]|nr:chemotaxis protein CheB [Alphaproteobacteria bacterium]
MRIWAHYPAPVEEGMYRDLIAIGGSAGSLDTLLSIAAALPAGFGGNVLIVVHIGQSSSRLPWLLARAGRAPASHPRDSEPIQPGHIYVAPPDHHLVVERDLLRLSRGPREHFTRPAIDPLFRSVAAVYAARVIGVVLSGGGSDGAAGLDMIKRGGGLAVVLDPNDAVTPEMPQAAAAIVGADYVVPGNEIAGLLVRLLRENVPVVPAHPTAPPEQIEMPERPLTLSCPECGGALRKVESSPAQQYLCHIGHRFGGEELLPAQLQTLETALHVAQRVLNERVELLRRMVEDSRAAGRQQDVRYWQTLQAETEKQADAIRQVLIAPAVEDDQTRREPAEKSK